MRFRPQAGKSEEEGRGCGGKEREDSLENRLMIETRRLTPSQWFSSQEQTNVDVQYQIQKSNLGCGARSLVKPKVEWIQFHPKGG